MSIKTYKGVSVTRWLVVVMLLGAFAVAGCGGSDSDDTNNAAASTGPAPAASADTGVADATELVTAAMKAPTWKSPGPVFDASKAKGKTVAIVSVGESVPAVHELTQEMVAAFKEAGVGTTVGDGKFSVTEFARIMRQATNAKVAAMILNAVDPKAVAQPLAQAKAAGIPVITMFEADPTAPLPNGVAGRADFSYSGAGELLAAWTASQSKGQARTLFVQSSDAPSQAGMLSGFKAGYSKYCGSCKLTVQDVAVADWATRLGPTIRSALLADPKIDYVLPAYDGMLLTAVPAIEQAHRKVNIASLNASPAVMKFLTGDRIQMEIGESNPWLSWAAVDQTLRVVSGAEPVADENVPLRVFTKENFPGDVGSATDAATWYGETDFKANYRKLWGL